MAENNKIIKVGLGVMIFKDGKVLMGERKNAHGEGEYAFPGGHLEFGESVFACARREVREETGIEIKNLRFLYFANLTDYPGKHYAHIEVVSDWKSGKPKQLEPDRGGEWMWYPLDKLPKPTFRSIKWCLEALKTGKNFFDSK